MAHFNVRPRPGRRGRADEAQSAVPKDEAALETKPPEPELHSDSVATAETGTVETTGGAVETADETADRGGERALTRSRDAENLTGSRYPMRRDGTGPMTRKPIDERFQCVYTKRNGERCGRAAVPGSSVCVKHGGAAPQVQRKARERVAMSADRAIKTILEIMLDESKPPAVRLKAARDIADRNDLAGAQKISMELKPFEQAVLRATRVVRTVKVRVNEDGSETVVEAEQREDGTAPIRQGIARVRRGRPPLQPGDVIPADPRVIEGTVVEPEPEWHDKLAAKAPLSEPVDYSERVGDDDGTPIPLVEPPTPPRERWVNSSDTPPKHSQAKLGYDPSAGRGGTRRTGSVMRNR